MMYARGYTHPESKVQHMVGDQAEGWVISDDPISLCGRPCSTVYRMPVGIGDVCEVCRLWSEGGHFKQPHEDVIGEQNDHPLLSLEDATFTSRLFVADMAKALQWTSSVASNTGGTYAKRLYERSRGNPKRGDWVIESSTGLYYPERMPLAMGLFLLDRWEWAETDEVHAAGIEQEHADHEDFLQRHPDITDYPFVPEQRAVDHVYYLQYGPKPADVARWENCAFFVIPLGEKF